MADCCSYTVVGDEGEGHWYEYPPPSETASLMIQYRSTIASSNFKKFPDLADFVPNAVVRKR